MCEWSKVAAWENVRVVLGLITVGEDDSIVQPLYVSMAQWLIYFTKIIENLAKQGARIITFRTKLVHEISHCIYPLPNQVTSLGSFRIRYARSSGTESQTFRLAIKDSKRMRSGGAKKTKKNKKAPLSLAVHSYTNDTKLARKIY